MKEKKEDKLKLAPLKEEVSAISCEARQLSSFLFELKLRNSNNFLIVLWLDRIQLKFIANRNIFVTINLLVLKLIHTCNSCIVSALARDMQH